jgi:hypothetical protein
MVFDFETFITETFLEMISTGARAPLACARSPASSTCSCSSRSISLFVFTFRVIPLSAAAPDVSRSRSACSRLHEDRHPSVLTNVDLPEPYSLSHSPRAPTTFELLPPAPSPPAAPLPATLVSRQLPG